MSDMPVNNELRGDMADQGDSGPMPSVVSPSDPYTDIYGWVQDLLEETDATLPGAQITRYVNSTLRFLHTTWDALPVYTALTDSDKSAIDEAVGHLVAARLRAKRPKKKTGEILLHKEGDTEKRYGAPLPAQQTLQDAWIDQAYTVLQEVACIAAVLDAARSVSLFASVGKRTEQRGRGVNTRSWNPLFTVLADEWDKECHELPPYGYSEFTFGW